MKVALTWLKNSKDFQLYLLLFLFFLYVYQQVQPDIWSSLFWAMDFSTFMEVH